MTGPADGLVERGSQIAELDYLLVQASEGTGALATVSGLPAMGKTALLGAFIRRAASRGAAVLAASSSRAERQVPYGVLGQLLGPEYADRHPRQAPLRGPAEAGAGSDLAVARQMYRVVSELAASAVVVITVDDIQHADLQSLRCLHYLAHRLTAIPVVMAVSLGQEPDQHLAEVLQDLLYRASARRVHLDPLSRRGVAELVTRHSGTATPAALAAQYYQLSGGNPLLVSAAAYDGQQHRAAAPPSSAAAAQGPAVTWDGPATGTMFGQAVLGCVHRAGPLGVRMARNIALLDGAGDISQLSRLCGIGTALAERIVEALSDMGVLAGSRFRHCRAQAAILDEIPVGEAVELRYRAARILYDGGAPPHRAAAQLVMAGPRPDDWAVSVLQDVAQRAMTDGHTALAIQYLDLAAECCAQQPARAAIKVTLAGLYRRLRPAASAQQFLSLKAAAMAGKLTGNQAMRVVVGLLWHLRLDAAAEVICQFSGAAAEHGLDEAQSRAIALILKASYPGVLGRLGSSVTAECLDAATSVTDTSGSGPEAALLAVLAQASDGYTIAQIEQFLESSEKACGSFNVFIPAVSGLIYADRLDSAAQWCDRLTATGGNDDAPTWRACVATYSALVSLRRGFPEVAVEQAQQALACSSEQEWYMETGLMLATVVEAHTAIGDHQIAAGYLSRPVPPALFQTRAGLHYLYARGRHQLATGRSHAALADFMSCGEQMIRWNMDMPALAPWRVGAAEAWLSLNETYRARQLLEEQLTMLGTGPVRTRGITLRCLAAVRDADMQALSARAAAVTVARRTGRVATSCHPQAPRHDQPQPYVPVMKTGEVNSGCPDMNMTAKLSASERRVALLAAQGYTNREISAELFITVSTVEQHLTRVYRKMKISSREQLAAPGAGLDDRRLLFFQLAARLPATPVRGAR